MIPLYVQYRTMDSWWVDSNFEKLLGALLRQPVPMYCQHHFRLQLVRLIHHFHSTELEVLLVMDLMWNLKYRVAVRKILISNEARKV